MSNSTDILKLPAGVLEGTKFFGEFVNCTDGKWSLRDNVPIANTSKLVVLETGEKLQKWVNGILDDEILPTPGKVLDDIDVLNAAIPVDQWGLDKNGKPRAPWQHAHLVYLIDPTNVDRYTFSSATIGARIAVQDLEERIEWMARFRGTNVHAVVNLLSRPMKTHHGLRTRPHFQLTDWVVMAGGGAPPVSIEGPKDKIQTIDTSKRAPTMKTVEPLTTDEELNDDLPF